MQTPQTLSAPLHQLHIGCGTNYRAGWVNVDMDPTVKSDIAAAAEDLPMLERGSCSVIESCSVLHRMPPERARAALREWCRVLAPGGELHLQLPNLRRCLQLIEEDQLERGLAGLFGTSDGSSGSNEAQPPRWAWTPESLARELYIAGFAEVEQVAPEGVSASTARESVDMRLRAWAPNLDSQVGHDQNDEPSDETSFINVFAWPNYSQVADLDHFFNVFARVLVGHNDVCLRLRVDPETDPSRDEVVAALGASHGRVLGVDADLNIALFEGPMTSEDWAEAGRFMNARIRLDHEQAPRNAADQLGTRTVVDAAGLLEFVQHWNPSTGASSSPAEPAADHSANSIISEATLADRINALHPWDYPLTIDGVTVPPGLGGEEDPGSLAARVACRSTVLLQEIFSRVDFRGKSLLDLGSDCGFWSSYYAMAGATRMLGIERDLQRVAQAELYWEANHFLPVDAYEFLQQDFTRESTWNRIRERGPVDICVWTGALHSTSNYAEVLGWAAANTREAMILDTRVSGTSRPAEDPDAPIRTELLQTLLRLGFEPEILPVGFGTQAGLQGPDSYADGSRLVILARRNS